MIYNFSRFLMLAAYKLLVINEKRSPAGLPLKAALADEKLKL
jgi:hypothetical protein